MLDEVALRRRALLAEVARLAGGVGAAIREARAVNLPTVPGISEAREALVAWAHLLDELLAQPTGPDADRHDATRQAELGEVAPAAGEPEGPSRRRLLCQLGRQGPAGTGQPVQAPRRAAGRRVGLPGGLQQPAVGSRIRIGYTELALRSSCWHSW